MKKLINGCFIRRAAPAGLTTCFAVEPDYGLPPGERRRSRYYDTFADARRAAKQLLPPVPDAHFQGPHELQGGFGIL